MDGADELQGRDLPRVHRMADTPPPHDHADAAMMLSMWS